VLACEHGSVCGGALACRGRTVWFVGGVMGRGEAWRSFGRGGLRVSGAVAGLGLLRMFSGVPCGGLGWGGARGFWCALGGVGGGGGGGGESGEGGCGSGGGLLGSGEGAVGVLGGVWACGEGCEVGAGGVVVLGLGETDPAGLDALDLIKDRDGLGGFEQGEELGQLEPVPIGELGEGHIRVEEVGEEKH